MRIGISLFNNQGIEDVQALVGLAVFACTADPSTGCEIVASAKLFDANRTTMAATDARRTKPIVAKLPQVAPRRFARAQSSTLPALRMRKY